VDNGSQMAVIPRTTGGSDLPWMLSTRAARRNARASRAEPDVPRERDLLLRATAEARTALEEAVVAAAVAAQRARSLTAMLEKALAVLEESENAPAPGPAPGAKTTGRADGLSPREKEVLALVAEGRTNKAIAEALYVSPNTVKTHVASLLSKLHAESRVQLAAMAARQVVL
jgi:DNA-binding NarL/FixJ family response regulator